MLHRHEILWFVPENGWLAQHADGRLHIVSVANPRRYFRRSGQ
jgi:hypothetical protein